MANLVVVRYLDGRVIKGTTFDFSPTKPVFHIQQAGGEGVSEVDIKDLKAVFFVKDLEGKPDYAERKVIPEEPKRGKGVPIAVLFKDGELLAGYTLGYNPGGQGFFVIPLDPDSNNIRIYVVRSSVDDVKTGEKALEIIRRGAKS